MRTGPAAGKAAMARGQGLQYIRRSAASSQSQQEINANYQVNYPRLGELKDKYDPTNLFRLNTNVRPSA